MILTVPDYIPISIFTYFSYFLNLFTFNSLPIKKKECYHLTSTQPHILFDTYAIQPEPYSLLF